MDRDEAKRRIEDLEASLPPPTPTKPMTLAEIADAATRAIHDEWLRCCAHLPRDVHEALGDEPLMRSVPDPNADDGVHGMFLFDGGHTLVSYMDEHAVVQRKQVDGSVLVIWYGDGEEAGRRIVPRTAFELGDPSAN